MKFLSNVLLKAGLIVEGTTDLQGTATAVTQALSDSSTKIATTAFVKGQGYAVGNIYSTDGSLSGNRTITLNGSYLDIAGTTKTRFFANGNVVIDGASPVDAGFKFDVNGTVRVTSFLTVGSDAASATVIKGPSSDGSIFIGGSSMTTSIAALRNIIVSTVGSYSTLTGINNTFYGRAAGLNVTSGASNVFIGSNAGAGITSGARNVFVTSSDAGNLPSSLSYSIHLVAGNGYRSNDASSIPSGTHAFFGGGFNTGFAVKDFYFGQMPFTADAGGGLVNIVFYAPSGLGTDIGGANFTLAAGRGTGAGTPGDFIIRTSNTTTTGSTLQTLADRIRVAGGTGIVTIANLAGTGSRMVVADSSGVLSTQAILSGNFVTLDTTQTITALKTFTSKVTINTGGTDDQLQLVGTAPSMRLTNAVTGATINGFIAMAGAANNYIQGAVAGDMTIGNQNNGRILFGFGSGTATQKMSLDANGNAVLSGGLTLGSTISNGIYTYTLPGATGTLALLSDIPSLSGYLTISSAASIYLSQTSASNTYLTISGAASTYLSQASASNTYLTISGASSIYLSQTSASNTYLTINGASSIYLSQTSASNTYLTINNAASTYVSLSGSYANPSWITSLAWSKITGAPAFITGITSGMVTTALGYTPYNSSNPNGYITSSALSGYATQSWVTSQGYLTSVTNIGGFSYNLYSQDIRTISPSSHGSYRLNFGFTSWNNNNTPDWADYLHLRSYSDGSGGADNLVMFRKNGIGMRIWQQSFGSASAYSSYVDMLHSSNYSSYALPLSGGTLTGPVSLNNNSYFTGSPSHGFRFNNSADTINAMLINNSGDVTAYSSMRAPIFYDSNDTSFYLDPNSFSRLSRVAVGGGANDVSGININGDAAIVGSNFLYFGHPNGTIGSWQTRTFASGGRQIWNTNGFEVNRDGYGGGLIIYSDSSARVGFATSDFSYTASDNTPVIGSITNNRLFVNGSIQLLGNNDAITFGRGTATFLKDEELGFGWGGGWYMEEGTWIRARNNKSIYTAGTIRSDSDMRAPIYYDHNDTSYYGDFASTSRFNATVTNTSYFGADTNKGYAQGFGTYSSSLHRIGYMSFDWDSNYNAYANHGIASTDINGSFSDSMSINSYNDITLRLDSNDNNGNSYLRISNNTTGSGTIAWIGYESGMNQNYFSGSVGISAGPRTDGYKLNMGGSIHLNGNSVDYVGSLYFNNAGHIQPNAGSYGALQMTNAKNGWAGIRFTESEVNLMMNTNESGHYRNGYGWQFRWYNGTMYISTGANGGGSEYTVLHTGNAPRASNSNLVYYAGFTLNANTMPTNSTGFTYSDGAPTTGPIVRFGDGNYDLQFNAYYYWGDQLYYRTRNGDTGNWNSWHTIVTSSNIGSQSVSYAATAGNANSISGAVGGSYTWTATNYFRSTGGGYSGSLASPPLQAYSDSNNSAYMSFHKGGHYAVNLGLDADNVMRIGGWSASANRWQLDMSGNMTVAGDVTAYSDARVKENVITVDNALSKVLALRGVYYNRTDSEDKNRKIGVIAQETMTVIPEVVNQDNAGMYNVSYGNLGGLFIEAFKEQQKRIEAQDRVIEELKSKLDAVTK